MAAYHKVEVSLNTNAVEVGVPSPQTVNVVVPTIGPAGPTGSVGPVGPTGPQGVPGTGLEVLTTQGDILYQGASTGQRLAIGTSGQILRVANGIPSWGNESGAVTSVNGETGTVILDGRDIDTSGNDDSAAFFTYEFADGNGIYYPLPDSTLNSKRVYRNTTGHHVFFQSLRWHITDGSPITANIIESSDDDNAAWPWLSAWGGSIEKAKLSTIVGRARSTFLFVGDSVPNTSVSGLGTAATADSTAFAAASHTHTGSQVTVGTTANLPLKTGTNGVIEAGSFGTAAGSFCEGNDARLSDARTPSSTLAHKESHAISGSDFLAPSDIGAQSIFARSEADVPVSGPLQLSAARAAIISVRNARSEARDVYLPMTSIQNGDIIVVVGGGTLTNPINIKVPAAGGAAIVDPNGGAVTISVTGQQYRFIVDAVGNFIPWTRVSVDTHTHVVADVTGAAASGSITSSGLTQATARILGRTSSSTGAVEEITVGTGLSLAAGELSATGSGVTAVGASTADVLSVSGSDLVADDPNADRIVFWDDSESKLRYLEAGSGLSISGTTLTATATGTIGGGTGSTDNSILRSDGTGGSTLQDSALVIDDATTTTQNNVAIRNNHSETNSSIVLQPKGTGAFIVGPKPDGTATGGNARGSNAIDLQITRASASQVASGARTFIGGGENNTASGANTVVCGGRRNVASSSSDSFPSAVVGGDLNTASGLLSFVGAGSSNTASNSRDGVVAGITNTASGNASFIGGGESNTTNQQYAGILCGRGGLADRFTIQAHAAGSFAANGDAQRIRAVLRCKTTTNAAVETSLNGDTVYLTIPSGKVMFCNIKVVGVRSTGAEVATYERQYAAKNVAGTSSEVFAAVTIGADNAAGTSLEIATVDAGDYIRIRPTGVASQTWRWVASIDCVEVAYGT